MCFHKVLLIINVSVKHNYFIIIVYNYYIVWDPKNVRSFIVNWFIVKA